MTVGSKWGYAYTADWKPDAHVHEVKDLSLETLERQIAESRAQLDDQLCLYQIHSATLESGVLEDRRVLAKLVQLANDGLAIGLTVSGPRQAETVRRTRRDGRRREWFRCVKRRESLEPSAAPLWMKRTIVAGASS